MQRSTTMTDEKRYPKGTMFLDKETLNLYVSDGDQWLEIIPSFNLKPLALYLSTLKNK